jgi:tripartite-type tricarboxylate transporter receptor subunit TctC
MKTRLDRALTAAVFALATAAPAIAEAYPSRPIRIVVNSSPGGLLDMVTRLVGQQMSDKLGQPVIIDNKAGADGLLGIRYAKTQPADGYTVLATAGTIAIQPALKQDPGYDPVKDFTGIGPMVRSPLLMVVGPGQPDKTLNDFIARAKASPDKLSYASAGTGTTTYMGAAMFLQQAGLHLLHVPYKGNAAAMSDVIAGRVGMIFEAYGSGAAKVKAGQLRALGVTSTARLPALPEVPTITEQAVPGFNYYLWLGLLAPAGTPPEAVSRLSEALRAALGSKELAQRLRADAAEPMPMQPEAFNEFLRREVAQMNSFAAELGLPKQ